MLAPGVAWLPFPNAGLFGSISAVRRKGATGASTARIVQLCAHAPPDSLLRRSLCVQIVRSQLPDDISERFVLLLDPIIRYGSAVELSLQVMLLLLWGCSCVTLCFALSCVQWFVVSRPTPTYDLCSVLCAPVCGFMITAVCFG